MLVLLMGQKMHSVLSLVLSNHPHFPLVISNINVIIAEVYIPLIPRYLFFLLQIPIYAVCAQAFTDRYNLTN